jgi:hypothetical protein
MMAQPQHQNYFDRKLRATTGYAARLLELFPGRAGLSHTRPRLSPPLGFASPGFQPLRGSPQLADHQPNECPNAGVCLERP